MPIYYIDRKTGEKKQEIVFGDKFLRWVYETKSGALLLEALIKRKLFSSWYGIWQNTRYSRRKIRHFVDSLQIDLKEAVREDIDSYRTFNDFFARELKPEARPVVSDRNVLVSPADGRIYAWENISIEKLVQVKGLHYSLGELIGDPELAKEYALGTCIIIRLCPADYHRYHFPDSGIPERPHRIKGYYYSVNPRALKKVPRLYCENVRELTHFSSDNFGDILLLEVGATCVGSIVQTYIPQQRVNKGSEKGYFIFGGSTVIMLLRKGKVRIDPDILENTSNDIETKVCMGEQIGRV